MSGASEEIDSLVAQHTRTVVQRPTVLYYGKKTLFTFLHNTHLKKQSDNQFENHILCVHYNCRSVCDVIFGYVLLNFGLNITF